MRCLKKLQIYSQVKDKNMRGRGMVDMTSANSIWARTEIPKRP